MCEPVSMMNLATQVDSVRHQGIKADEAAKEFNTELLQDYRANIGQLQEQRRQTGQKQQQEDSEIARQARLEQSRLATLSGDNGMAGNTADRLLTESAFAADEARGQLRRNYENAIAQSGREAEGMRRSAKAAMRARTDWRAIGLQIQGLERQAFGQYLANERAAKQ